MEAKEYVARKLPTPDGFETYCKNRFDHIVFVKRDEEIPTAEYGDRPITRKLLRKNTNFNNLYQKIYVSVDVSCPNRIEQHNYMVEREIYPHTLKEKIYFTLFNLAVLEKGKVVEISMWDYPYCQYAFGKRSMVYHGSYVNDCYHFYNDWLKDSPLSEIATGYESRRELQHAYLHRKNLIMCKERGMNQMFKDILSNQVDWRIMSKARIKKYWTYIADHDMDFDEFKAFIILLKNGVKLTHMNYDALPNIDVKIDKSKHTGVSVTRIMNYIYRQERKLSYYYDYLNTLVDIKAKAETERVFFPKSLVEAHDNAVRTLNTLKIKADERGLKKITKKLIQLEYEGSKYAVVAPKSLFDITREGKNLDHCVGGSSYLNGHKNGEFAIMFVRLKDDKSKSFYTFTYKYNKSISALHGYRNQDSTDPRYLEVKEFVYNEWLSWVKQQKTQPKQKKVRMQPSNQMVMQG